MYIYIFIVLEEKLKVLMWMAFGDIMFIQIESSIFWDVVPCIPPKVKQRFGGACHLYLQGQRMSQARN
jgi:hypothetical protein